MNSKASVNSRSLLAAIRWKGNLREEKGEKKKAHHHLREREKKNDSAEGTLVMGGNNRAQDRSLL